MKADSITTNKENGQSGDVTVGILGTSSAEAYNIQVGGGTVAGTLTLNNVEGRLSSSTASAAMTVGNLSVQGDKSNLQAYALEVGGGNGTVALGNQSRLRLDAGGRLSAKSLSVQGGARFLATSGSGGTVTGSASADGTDSSGAPSSVMADAVEGSNIRVANGAEMAVNRLGSALQNITLQGGGSALILGAGATGAADFGRLRGLGGGSGDAIALRGIDAPDANLLADSSTSGNALAVDAGSNTLASIKNFEHYHFATRTLNVSSAALALTTQTENVDIDATKVHIDTSGGAPTMTLGDTATLLDAQGGGTLTLQNSAGPFTQWLDDGGALLESVFKLTQDADKLKLNLTLDELYLYGSNTSGTNTAGQRETDNTLTLTASNKASAAFAGRASNGKVSGNTLTIDGAATLQKLADTTNPNHALFGNAYGGYADNGDATGNTVILSSSMSGQTADFGVYGGYSASGGDTSGNTLDVQGGGITLQSIGGFDAFQFSLDRATPGTPAVTLTAQSAALNVDTATLRLASSGLTLGDTYILLADASGRLSVSGNTTIPVAQGLFLEIGSDNGTSITAKVSNQITGVSVAASGTSCADGALHLTLDGLAASVTNIFAALDVELTQGSGSIGTLHIPDWTVAADANGQATADVPMSSIPGCASIPAGAGFIATTTVTPTSGTPQSGSATHQWPAPDLRVQLGTDAGGNFIFKAKRSGSATIFNDGSADAVGVVWQATKAGTVIASGTVASIAAGASAAIMIEAEEAEVKGATVCVSVDPANAIAESDEGNNESCGKVAVQAATGGVQPVPTLGEVGLLLSGLALAGAAAPALRRRRKQIKKSDTLR